MAGGGVLGQLLCQICKIRGAKYIIATASSLEKAKAAKLKKESQA